MATSDKFDQKSWQDGGLTSFSQTCFAEYWHKLPKLIDETKTTNCTTTTCIDPYNFEHRMALGKYLIENIGSENVWGKDFTGHWFWGYLAQMDWQWRTGRYITPSPSPDPTSSTGIHKSYGHKISTDSWFGYMNLNFSVAVYAGAAKAGLVPGISLSVVKKEDGEVLLDIAKDPGFKKCVVVWEAYWSGPHQAFLDDVNATNGTDKESSIDRLYEAIWASHTDIIKSSLPYAERLLSHMPAREQSFGLGWCRMVELLAAMRMKSLSLDSLMEHGAGHLPSRVLDEESMDWILKEKRVEEHHVANMMFDLYKAHDLQMSLMCGFYRRLVTWDFERKQLPKTFKVLNSIETGTGKKIFILARWMAKVMFPQSISEHVAWQCAIAGIFLASGMKYTKT